MSEPWGYQALTADSPLNSRGPGCARGTRIRRAFVALSMSVGLALTACANPSASPGDQQRGDEQASSAAADNSEQATVRIATGVDQQTEVIAHLYQQKLEAAGIPAKVVDVGAQRSAIFSALKSGRVDVVPDFSGALYAHTRARQAAAQASASPSASAGATPTPTPTPSGVLDSLGRILGAEEKTGPSADEIYQSLEDSLPKGLSLLNQSGAERTETLVTTAAVAAEYQLSDMASMAEHCPELTLGFPPNQRVTAQGLPGLKTYYSCVPAKDLEISTVAQRVDAVENQRAHAVVLPRSSPAINDGALVVLADPAHLFRPERLVPLSGPKLPDLAVGVLNDTNATVKTEDLTLISRLIAGEKPVMTPQQAARFLQDRPR